MTRRLTFALSTISALLLGGVLGSIAAAPAQAAVDDPRLSAFDEATWHAYYRAVVDSTVARPYEVVHDLLVPTPADPRTQWTTIDGEEYLLVATMGFKPVSTAAPGTRLTLGSSKWVSVPGDLDQACLARGCEAMDAANLDLQLKMILGLPPDADARYVSRFWVRPADMFRPCTDPRITSSSCPETLATGTPDAPIPVTVDQVNVDHFLWEQTDYAWRLPDLFAPDHLVSCSFDFQNTTQGQCMGFPWTRLGYTYDWTPGAPDHVGVSEFIVAAGASVVLEGVGSQRQYHPYTGPA